MPAIVKSGTFSADSVLVATGTAAVAKAANALLAADGSLTLGSASNPYVELSCSVGTVSSRLGIGGTALTDHRVLFYGHNRTAGGRIDGTKAAAAIACEYMYGSNILEFNVEATDAAGNDYRPLAASTNVSGENDVMMLGAIGWFADDGTTVRAGLSRTGEFSIGATAAGSAQLLVTQRVNTSGTPVALKVVSAAHTTLAVTQDLPQVVFDLTARQESATGAKAQWNGVEVIKPTFAFVGDSTIADAATFFVSGAPVAGAHATITKAWAIRADGKMRVSGQHVVSDPAGMRLVTDIDAATPVGIDILRTSTTKWALQAVSTIHDLGLGFYCTIQGIDGSYTPPPGIFSTSPGIDPLVTPGTGGAMGGIVNSNPTAATAGAQSRPSPPLEMIGQAWNTGGTPATEQWDYWWQVIPTGGNPSTALLKLTAKRGATANVPLFAIPGTVQTITGAKGGNAALTDLIAKLVAIFPVLADGTT